MKTTIERKCSSEGCEYVFKPVPVLYGSSALGKCPRCGVFVNLKLEAEAPAAEPATAPANGEARNRILALLTEINEVFEECSDLTIAEQVELSIEMAEQAITRLGDATEDATSDEDAETIKRSFDACEKMTQELEDITQI